MSIHELPAAAPLELEPQSLASLSTYRFDIEQYHRLIETGILGEDDKVQLLEGWIVEMTPIGIPHVAAVMLAFKALDQCCPSQWHVQVQQPITIGNSEPEPDVFVARGGIRDYLKNHPGPGDIGLIVEVADSSLELDRRLKARIYAAAGVPEYWIVNLIERTLEVHRDPRPADAATQALYARRDLLRSTDRCPLTLDGKSAGEILVADVLP